MPDWGSRLGDDFRFVRVSWPDMAELGELSGITGGSIKQSMGEVLRCSGSIGYAFDPEVGNDLVRVYANSSWADGSELVTCLGTFLWATDRSGLDLGRKGGEAKVYSTLKVLSDWCEREPFSLAAGENAIACARRVCESCHLRVSCEPSDTVLSASHTWEAGTSRLSIVNWLLEFAGYDSANVDGMGTVIMVPKAVGTGTNARVTLSDGIDGCFASEVTVDRDDFDTPNVAVATLNRADTSYSVSVEDRSSIPYGIDARGREVTCLKSFSDIDSGASEPQILDVLAKKAALLLAEGRQTVESATITHYWVPFDIGDTIAFRYAQAGYSQSMTAYSRQVDLVTGMPCTTVLRRSDI